MDYPFKNLLKAFKSKSVWRHIVDEIVFGSVIFLLCVFPAAVEHRRALAAFPDMMKRAGALQTVPAGNGNHDCSGDLKFGWSMESTTVGSGSPAGCTDGQATTATANGAVSLSGVQKSDGTYSALANGASGYYSFANFDNDELDLDEGKIVLDFYVTTWASGGMIFRGEEGSNERIQIELSSSGAANQINVKIERKTLGADDSVSITATEDVHTTGEWFRLTYQWIEDDATSVNPDHASELCELTLPDTTSNCVTNIDNDDPVAMSATVDTGYIGSLGTAAVIYIDNFQIFATSGL